MIDMFANNVVQFWPSLCEAQLCENQNLECPENPIFAQRNDEVLIEGYEYIGENLGVMSKVSLKISRKIRQFSPLIPVAILSGKFGNFLFFWLGFHPIC